MDALDSAMSAVATMLATGYGLGLAFVGLVLLTSRRGGE